jgi:hypothetical protein
MGLGGGKVSHGGAENTECEPHWQGWKEISHKKKELQKKRKFVGLSVCSVWSVVFVGTTEYTEYTEGRARRRDYP